MSLVGHYKFDGDYLDSSGQGNDGTNNGVTFEDGYIGQAGDFDGSSYINIDDLLTNDLAGTTQGTWMAWIYPTNLLSSAEYIFQFGDTNGNRVLRVFLFDIGKIQFSAVGENIGKWRLYTNNVVLSNNVGACLFFVQDGTEAIIYVNGIAVGQSFNITVDKTWWFNDDALLNNGRIGNKSYNNSGEVQHFNGLIDSVRFYTYALSPDEILDRYNTDLLIHNGGILVNGITYNRDSSVIVPNTTVRLYDNTTFKLEDETESNDIGQYGFGIVPQDFAIVAYKPDDGNAVLVEGSHLGTIDVETKTYFIEGQIVDASIDLLTIQDMSVMYYSYFSIRSTDPATENVKFEFRTEANGAGDVIEVWFEVGDTFKSSVGQLIPVSSKIYFRTDFVGAGLNNLTIEVWANR